MTMRRTVQCEPRRAVDVLVRLPEVDLVDDKAEARGHLSDHRPPAVITFGNSDGDFEMLEWTTSAPGPRLAAIVHHTDGDREYAYDRDSHIGQLVRGLDEASRRHWVLIDMKRDLKTLYRQP